MIIKRKFFTEHTYLKGFKDNLSALLFGRAYKKVFRQMDKVLPSHFELKRKDYPRPSFSFNCTSCELCVSACPTVALKLVASNQIDLNSHLLDGPKPKHLFLEEKKCTKCGLCVEICPTDALVLQTSNAPVEAMIGSLDLKKLSEEASPT